jgi:hypothetical protein
MKTDGLQRMLQFLDELRDRGIRFRLERERPEAIMVTFSFRGTCVEVEFFTHEIEFSYFRSDGVEQTSEQSLRDYIVENWTD